MLKVHNYKPDNLRYFSERLLRDTEKKLRAMLKKHTRHAHNPDYLRPIERELKKIRDERLKRTKEALPDW